jgi:hypothetical protein
VATEHELLRDRPADEVAPEWQALDPEQGGE